MEKETILSGCPSCGALFASRAAHSCTEVAKYKVMESLGGLTAPGNPVRLYGMEYIEFTVQGKSIFVPASQCTRVWDYKYLDVVLDKDGRAWQMRRGYWYKTGGDRSFTTEELVKSFGPLKKLNASI